jgi:hypothetical protein
MEGSHNMNDVFMPLLVATFSVMNSIHSQFVLWSGPSVCECEPSFNETKNYEGKHKTYFPYSVEF